MSITALETRPNGIQPIPLGHGTWVTIRSIESSDWEGLFDFYRSLSPDARHARFLGMAPGIDRQAAHHFAEAGEESGAGFVAVLREAGPRDGQIVGHLCLEPIPSGGHELAVAVADDIRRRGIGRRLMTAGIRAARERGVSRLIASMFADNGPMLRLFLTAGAPIVRLGTDAGITSIELNPAASPATKEIERCESW